MKKLVTLAAALALLCTSVDLHQMVFGKPAYAEFGTNEDRGYGPSPGKDRSGDNRSWGERFMDGLRGLLDLSRGGLDAPKKGKGNPKKVDRSKPDKMDRSTDRTDRNGNRGGPYD